MSELFGEKSYAMEGNHMNKWKAIPVAKAVRVVMQVPRDRCTRRRTGHSNSRTNAPGLATPHTERHHKGVDQRAGKIALDAVTSGTDDRLVPPRYLVVDNDKK